MPSPIAVRLPGVAVAAMAVVMEAAAAAMAALRHPSVSSRPSAPLLRPPRLPLLRQQPLLFKPLL